MENVEVPDSVRLTSRDAFNAYIDALVPLRPDLHRYCRKLTGDIWDAEDLVQDTLLKGFVALGRIQGPVPNLKGYLVRIATNLWIDTHRRRVTGLDVLASQAVTASPPEARPGDPVGVRNAAAQLMESLAPQERAALVLKEVFDMSLKDIAEMLATTENAVKAALHRGRSALKDPAAPRRRSAPPALVEKFVKCLDAADLRGLLALMLDTAVIEMPPVLIESGRAQFERKGSWLWQSVNVHPELPADMRPPKWQNRIVDFGGETLVLGLMPPSHGGTLQGITRLEEEDGRVARIRSYGFTPETVAEVAAELGLQAGWVPYRFPMPPAALG